MTTRRRLAAVVAVALLFLFQSYRLQQLLLATTPEDTTEVLETFKNSGNFTQFNRLVHVTIFGLGHRLCRATAAYHLAKKLKLPRIKHQWGTCGEDHDSGPKIFTYLFGNDVFPVPIVHESPNSPSVVSVPHSTEKEILVKNDVYGYSPGQAFKNFHVPLPKLYRLPSGPFLSKLASDAEFYKLLSDSYVHKDEVNKFRAEQNFKHHTVLGLHLRAGNGEETHFLESGRGIADETEFVTNLMDLLRFFLQKITATFSSRFSQRPPLLFLATDTAYLVPTITNATRSFGVPTVVLPQIRVKAKEGVTFKALKGAGEKCLQGWEAMFSDMLLLSHSDVLIAARRSSFTQSLPMSIVFDRAEATGIQGPNFCEVSDSGTTMTCLEDLSTWLFRDDESKIFTYSTEDILSNTADVTNESKQTKSATQFTGPHPVVHKVLVHLPDVEPPKEFDHAFSFLSSSARQIQGGFTTHTYGKKRFNPKYRNRKSDDLVATFTFIDALNASSL